MTASKRAPYSYAVSVALVVLGTGYLGLTGLYGEYGMMRLVKAEAEAEELERELRALQVEQAAVERDLRALSPASLDLDALEERLRVVLGWGHRDDLLLSPEAEKAPVGLRWPQGGPADTRGAGADN